MVTTIRKYMHVTVHNQARPLLLFLVLFCGYKRAWGGGEPGDEATFPLLLLVNPLHDVYVHISLVII